MNTQQLKELAQRATPWPWKWFTSNSHNRLSSVPSGKDGDVISVFKAVDGVACVSVSRADMAFIEAAHPGAVIELIERMEAAERERDEMRAQLKTVNDQRQMWVDHCKTACAELDRRNAAAGEPVAWVCGDEEIRDFKAGREVTIVRDCDDSDMEYLPLYTAAPHAVLPPEMDGESVPEGYCSAPDHYTDGYNQCRADALALGAQPQKVVELPSHIRPVLVDVLTWIERLPVPTKSAAAKAMRLHKVISELDAAGGDK